MTNPAEHLSLLHGLIDHVQGSEVKDALRWAIAELSPKVNQPKGGIAAIIGKWPGDETDEQIDEAIRRLDGPLTISQALRLARDEGKRVRCKGWESGWYVEFGGTYFAVVTDDEVELYEPTTSEAEAEWEVLP